MYDRFLDWKSEFEKLQSGEISKDEYDEWRYSYPILEARLQKAVRRKK